MKRCYLYVFDHPLLNIMSQVQCSNCESFSPSKAYYCVDCGKPIIGVKSRFKGFQKRIRHQTKDVISNLKSNLTEKIESLNQNVTHWISQLDTKDQVKIGGINIPENRKQSIKYALQSFQNRFTEESHSEEYQDWLSKLPEMLEEQKCIVCFLPWKADDTIVVCKHCQSGGHKSHIENWINDMNNCPLCRRSLNKYDLITVDINS